ncbi:hypothetical protein [Cryobacterium sp. Y11]|uniref:hypothetical protein n=1 Tax=Cryobacterium sp. Y11 TaxID=2045016 RepID=UPI000CE3473A|nr:hypothetical protein [Cryobacterium sp. Y11]
MWTVANPGLGEPDSILSEARVRSGKADALRTLQTTLAGAQSQAQTTDWTAVSRDAFVERLVALVPEIDLLIHGLDALARVAANRLNASTRITEIDAESAKLDAENAGMDRTRGRWEQSYGRSDQIVKEQELLEAERSYLQRAIDGKNQLYLYDYEGARIIQMLGTPSSETRQRITYVPGTMSNMEMFQDGSVQPLSDWIVNQHPDTVAFIYKDGLFPGDSDGPRGDLVKGIPDANPSEFAKQTGPVLADFETGLAADHRFTDVISTAISHSWGLANITSAEVSGAHYD